MLLLRQIQSLLRLAIIVPLCLPSLGAAAHAQSARCKAPDIEINYVSGETPNLAAPFARDIRYAIDAVGEWWGPTYDGPFRIEVNNVVRESMALVPAWIGKIGHMVFPERVVYRGRAATVHE